MTSLVAGHQQLTQEWWVSQREKFDLFISQTVLEEAAAGDKEAAQERLAVLAPLPLLELVDYLLTWNCKHIANAAMRSQIEQIGYARGYEPVIICTPEELMED